MDRRSKDYDPLATTLDSEDDDGTAARQRRREQREQRRVEARTMDDATAAALLRDEEECTSRMEKVSTKDNPMEGTSRKLTRNNFPVAGKKADTIQNKSKGAADPGGAAPRASSSTAADPSGAAGTGQGQTLHGARKPPADLHGAGAEKLSKLTSGTYESVHLNRKKAKVNPCLRGGVGGVDTERADIGSFAVPGDARIEKCQTRFLFEKKQNISFSFDPVTMMCYGCGGRGAHPVTQEGGGGVKQCFILADHNFPANVPCANGECLKIIRIEDGALPELVNCWLEVTKNKTIPKGSVVVMFSTTHLLMEGLAGYVEDMIREIKKIKGIFGGGGRGHPRGAGVAGGDQQPRTDSRHVGHDWVAAAHWEVGFEQGMGGCPGKPDREGGWAPIPAKQKGQA